VGCILASRCSVSLSTIYGKKEHVSITTSDVSHVMYDTHAYSDTEISRTVNNNEAQSSKSSERQQLVEMLFKLSH